MDWTTEFLLNVYDMCFHPVCVCVCVCVCVYVCVELSRKLKIFVTAFTSLPEGMIFTSKCESVMHVGRWVAPISSHYLLHVFV